MCCSFTRLFHLLLLSSIFLIARRSVNFGIQYVLSNDFLWNFFFKYRWTVMPEKNDQWWEHKIILRSTNFVDNTHFHRYTRLTRHELISFIVRGLQKARRRDQLRAGLLLNWSFCTWLLVRYGTAPRSASQRASDDTQHMKHPNAKANLCILSSNLDAMAVHCFDTFKPFSVHLNATKPYIW